MSKILKLVGIQSYISAATNNDVVLKGKVCRFSDVDAAKLLKGTRVDKEGEEVAYWKECEDDTKLDHDFYVPPVTTTTQSELAAGLAEVAAQATRVVTRQRAAAK
jgi:hypothetical protein